MNSHALLKPRPLGLTLITANALNHLQPEDVTTSLRRHAHRDWGRCGRQDAPANDTALDDGCRLLSAHRDRHGVEFWIITDADQRTTVLLPEDY